MNARYEELGHRGQRVGPLILLADCERNAGRLARAIGLADEAVTLARELDRTYLLSSALPVRARIHFETCAYGAAAEDWLAAATEAHAQTDDALEAACLSGAALARATLGDLYPAAELCERARAIIADRALPELALAVAALALAEGDAERARSALERLVDDAKLNTDVRMRLFLQLGLAFRALGDAPAAARALRLASDLSDEIGSPLYGGRARIELAMLDGASGAEPLEIARTQSSMGDRFGLARTLDVLSLVLLDADATGPAATMRAASQTLRDEIGARMPIVWRDDIARIDRRLAADPDRSAIDEASSIGRSITVSDAIGLADAALGRAAAVAPSDAG